MDISFCPNCLAPTLHRFYYVTAWTEGGFTVGTHHYFREWSLNRFNLMDSYRILGKGGLIIDWHEISREEHRWFESATQESIRKKKLEELYGRNENGK